jgi:hypothetical protein
MSGIGSRTKYWLWSRPAGQRRQRDEAAMRKVDEYLRNVKLCRERAARQANDDMKASFEAMAIGWQLLARERLALLEEKLQRGKLGPSD